VSEEGETWIAPDVGEILCWLRAGEATQEGDLYLVSRWFPLEFVPSPFPPGHIAKDDVSFVRRVKLGTKETTR
jgi:hypothetical protein